MRRIVPFAALLSILFSFAASASAAEPTAESALKRIGVDRGVCVVLGAPDASFPVELARRSELTLYVQTADTDELDAVRRAADAAGLLAGRIYTSLGDFDDVQLADNLADAIVVTASARGDGGVERGELLRVLHPGAKALLGEEDLVAESAAGHDEWTHPYHGPDNNPQSKDTIARAPYLTQFLAEPWYCPMPEVTVSSGGRLFKAFGHISFKEREWPLLNKLYCLNSYNGTLLWKRDLTPGFMIHRNTLVATPEVLYLGDDKSCKIIDAATGEVRDEITVPKQIAAGGVWKWMALDGGVLYALLGEKEPLDKVLRGTRTAAGWPWSGLGSIYDKNSPYPWGFGRTFVAIDPATKRVLWSHNEPEPIDSRATCMNSRHIYFFSHPKYLAALDRKTGKEAWRSTDAKLLEAVGAHDPAQNPRLGFASTAYAKCSEDAIYFAGPQRRRLVAASTKDGGFLWDHDAGNYQLVLRDDALYAMGRNDTSKKFNPLTGEVLADLQCFRGNCTRATGTFDSIFSRGHPHTGTLRLDLSSSEAKDTRIPLMRPACQDGVLVSHGQLFWGPWMCDCNLQLVGVISLGSAGNFDFAAEASDAARLHAAAAAPQQPARLETTPADWATYRHDNARSGASPVSVSAEARRSWQYTPKAETDPAAPIAAGGLVFVSGSDGAVRALDAATGSVRWTAYTGGPLKYPPAVWQGRLYAGSCDGWVYAYEAASGQPLWRFRAAPAERTIPVYGTLSSTWPVAGGVLVQDGAVYAAAGIASYDGTHVYALDAVSGRLRWHNNSSGRLTEEEDRVTGISVQGHLLLHEDKLYMPGGNVVSPAVYDTATGRCLNKLGQEGEWQKGPRGRELFLVDGQVRVFDQLLYSPKDYQQGRYFSKDFFLQAGTGDSVVRAVQDRIVRLDATKSTPAKPVASWEFKGLSEVAALAVTQNAVLAAGRSTEAADGEAGGFRLTAIRLADGSPLWTQPLPAPASSWGLAVDRDGRVLVSLRDGRVICFK